MVCAITIRSYKCPHAPHAPQSPNQNTLACYWQLWYDLIAAEIYGTKCKTRQRMNAVAEPILGKKQMSTCEGNDSFVCVFVFLD